MQTAFRKDIPLNWNTMSYRTPHTVAIIRTAIACLAAAVLVLPAAALESAQADESSQVRSELSHAVDEISSISSEMEAAQAEAERLAAEIDAKAQDVEAAQSEVLARQDEYDKAAVALYKAGGGPGLLEMVLSSNSFDEMLENFACVQRVEEHTGGILAEKKRAQLAAEEELEQLHARKDAQEEAISRLEESKGELESKVDSLKGRIDELDAAQRAAYYAEASRLSQAQAFASGDTSGWQTGVASAYGGHSDAAIADNQGTATGEAVTETSMGVAIPTAWENFRSYYGRKVEISYNGKSVIATVNDCGGMGGGSRSLDLQPGVFRALGFETCDEWGLRTVSYRFL